MAKRGLDELEAKSPSPTPSLLCTTDDPSVYDDDGMEGITRGALQSKANELAHVMEMHSVSGYGNVERLKDALLRDTTRQGTSIITLQHLDDVVKAGVSGAPYGKTVHKWFRQIVETGECDYIAHVKATRPRQRRA